MDIDTRRLVGGALCLDFANSIDWASDGRERPSHTEALGEPADLLRWGRRLGLLDAAAAPTVTGRELAASRRLRLAIHRVFAATATEAAPEPDSLAEIVHTYADAVAAAELAAGNGNFLLEWRPDDPRRIRFTVAASAIDTLRDAERLARVRQCPGNNCGWLFLDATGRRRWCSMEVCGSRAKMRDYYRRQHEHASATQKPPGRQTPAPGS